MFLTQDFVQKAACRNQNVSGTTAYDSPLPRQHSCPRRSCILRPQDALARTRTRYTHRWHFSSRHNRNAHCSSSYTEPAAFLTPLRHRHNSTGYCSSASYGSSPRCWRTNSHCCRPGFLFYTRMAYYYSVIRAARQRRPIVASTSGSAFTRSCQSVCTYFSGSWIPALHTYIHTHIHTYIHTYIHTSRVPREFTEWIILWKAEVLVHQRPVPFDNFENVY